MPANANEKLSKEDRQNFKADRERGFTYFQEQVEAAREGAKDVDLPAELEAALKPSVIDFFSPTRNLSKVLAAKGRELRKAEAAPS